MNPFEFYNPVRVIFGEGTLKQLGDCVRHEGKRALIVSYLDVKIYGELIDAIHQDLSNNQVIYEDFFAVTANPTIAQAEEGIRKAKAMGAEVIVAVGGGSVMDCAKVIAAGVVYPHEDIRKMIAFSHSDTNQIPPIDALPTIMIPTLPATGSEMNPTAVITDEQTHSKSYVYAPGCLYPKVALIDPTLSVSLPAYQTACAGFDTISHVLESYFNGDQSVNLDLQDSLQEGVVRTVLDTLPKVINDPTNIQLRGVMQWASTLGLNGFVTSGTYGWAPMHQMGHVLSARYHVTHGASLLVMMIAWLKYFSTHADNARYEQFARRVFNASITEAASALEQLGEQVGVETRLSKWGIQEEAIQALVEDVVRISFGDDGLLASSPSLTKDDVAAIYYLAL